MWEALQRESRAPARHNNPLHRSADESTYKTSTPSTAGTSSSPADGGQAPAGAAGLPSSCPSGLSSSSLAPGPPRHTHGAMEVLPASPARASGSFSDGRTARTSWQSPELPPSPARLACPERDPPPAPWVAAARWMQRRLLGLLRSRGRHGCLSHLGMPTARTQPAAVGKQDLPGQAHGQALESWELAAPLTGAPPASDSPL